MNIFSVPSLPDIDERLPLMKIVERVVRPVRANIARKRRMRDEMLAHLSAIYDEELASADDPIEAVSAAASRFGDPAELTTELQATVPFFERLEVAADSFGFGWRPPETVLQWMSRLAVRIGMVMLMSWVLAAFFVLREFGWNVNALGVLRPIAALAVVLPFSAAISGICYFRIRDHIYGVFGSRESWRFALAWTGLLAFVTAGCGLAYLVLAYGSLSPADVAFYPSIAVGVIWAAGALVTARNMGPQEIRDTTWALLDLDDQPLAA